MVGTREKYVEMLVDMDKSVGRVLEALTQAGLEEDTLVVYASDHGAMRPGFNTPLRDFKGTLFEGGIRVPCIARWPGRIPAGAVSGQVGSLMDLTASFLRVSGAEPPDGGPLDGIDILKHVQEAKPDIPRTLYWRARRGARTWWAVRDGDMKYVRKIDGDDRGEWLFDLAASEEEARDLSDDDPAELARLKVLLGEWETEVRPAR